MLWARSTGYQLENTNHFDSNRKNYKTHSVSRQMKPSSFKHISSILKLNFIVMRKKSVFELSPGGRYFIKNKNSILEQ